MEDECSFQHEFVLNAAFNTYILGVLIERSGTETVLCWTIIDVLEHAEDFETGDDIYDAVGGILHEVTGNNEDEDNIKSICEQLIAIIKRYFCIYQF